MKNTSKTRTHQKISKISTPSKPSLHKGKIQGRIREGAEARIKKQKKQHEAVEFPMKKLFLISLFGIFVFWGGEVSFAANREHQKCNPKLKGGDCLTGNNNLVCASVGRSSRFFCTKREEVKHAACDEKQEVRCKKPLVCADLSEIHDKTCTAPISKKLQPCDESQGVRCQTGLTCALRKNTDKIKSCITQEMIDRRDRIATRDAKAGSKENYEACTQDTDCKSKKCNISLKICSPKEGFKAGEKCSYKTDCVSGYCSSDTNVCLEKKGAGEECESFGECKSNKCEIDKKLMKTVCIGGGSPADQKKTTTPEEKAKPDSTGQNYDCKPNEVWDEAALACATKCTSSSTGQAGYCTTDQSSCTENIGDDADPEADGCNTNEVCCALDESMTETPSEGSGEGSGSGGGSGGPDLGDAIGGAIGAAAGAAGGLLQGVGNIAGGALGIAGDAISGILRNILGGGGGGGGAGGRGGCPGGTVFCGPGVSGGAGLVKQNLDSSVYKQHDLKKLMISWTRFLYPIAALAAVIALVWAGFLYITAFGDDSRTEMAKKIIIWVVAGILLIMGSFAIVNTIIGAAF